MIEAIYQAGALLRFRASVEKNKIPPEEGYELFSPDPTTITVTDSAGAVKIDNQPMVEYDTGKFYYDVQTATDWAITGACKATMFSGTTVIGVEHFRLSN